MEQREEKRRNCPVNLPKKIGYAKGISSNSYSKTTLNWIALNWSSD